jgi:hypothetical protein
VPETKEALIVVKTYPTPSQKSVETSCTAAITRAGEWLRLFPVPFRRLDEEQQFGKYQWVQVSVIKSSDARPESYKLDWTGSGGSPIRILGDALPTDHEWRARKEIVLPLRAPSLCFLMREWKKNLRPTLGIFRPRTIRRLLIEPDATDWSPKQLAALQLDQGRLFSDARQVPQLEKLPFRFLYDFSCDDNACRGHKLTCADWEIGQSWRAWQDRYGGGWEHALRQRYEEDMIQKCDTHFYVGTVHRHPSQWIIVGLFYPPKVRQADMFAMQ